MPLNRVEHLERLRLTADRDRDEALALIVGDELGIERLTGRRTKHAPIQASPPPA